MGFSIKGASTNLFLVGCLVLFALRSNRAILGKTSSDIAPITDVKRRLQGGAPDKPTIVIHIGPPKTGTTTLQILFNELEENGVFVKDNYHYDRKDLYWETIMNHSCQRQLMKLRQSYKTRNNRYKISEQDLAQKLRSLPCWADAAEKLQPYLVNRVNLFGSFETWSVANWAVETENGKSVVDWESVRLTLMNDWNVFVIFAYRRYPEWIFSSFQQMNRATTQRPKMKFWPGMGGKHISFGPDSTPLDHLPMSRSDMVPINYRYTDDLKREMDSSPYIPYAIFNMHERDASVVSFVCNLLPNAYHSCEYLQQREEEEEGKSYNPSRSLFYDALATAAYDAGLIEGNDHERLDVVDAVHEYHQDYLNQSPIDFPLICPTTFQLQGFLELSLLLEEDVVPEFANAPGVKEEHISNFWKQATDKKFCWIDTETALKSELWIEFFRNFRQ